MTKVITYGSFDLLHYGHRRLLERARALGDHLLVGVTSDDYERQRGKINVQQSLAERLEGVRALNLADELIVEEYDGQKIDDILKYGVDIFAIGSDWQGKFDYLKEYCQVVYLDRTEGVSSSELRAAKRHLRLGIIGNDLVSAKILRESAFVNGLSVNVVCTQDAALRREAEQSGAKICASPEELLAECDAVYIRTHPREHPALVRQALEARRHVLCEAPVTHSLDDYHALRSLADSQGVLFWDAIKTAHATAFHRLVLLTKTGLIGKVVAVDATCTSISDLTGVPPKQLPRKWSTFDAWGPTALLPIFEILGTGYEQCRMAASYLDDARTFDGFVQMTLQYPAAIANLKVAKTVKSEGELVVSGTTGYIYVPSPWWKTEYFEVRREDFADNRRYFYRLDGEGIRQMLVSFLKATVSPGSASPIRRQTSDAIVKCLQDFSSQTHCFSW